MRPPNGHGNGAYSFITIRAEFRSDNHGRGSSASRKLTAMNYLKLTIGKSKGPLFFMSVNQKTSSNSLNHNTKFFEDVWRKKPWLFHIHVLFGQRNHFTVSFTIWTMNNDHIGKRCFVQRIPHPPLPGSVQTCVMVPWRSVDLDEVQTIIIVWLLAAQFRVTSNTI